MLVCKPCRLDRPSQFPALCHRLDLSFLETSIKMKRNHLRFDSSKRIKRPSCSEARTRPLTTEMQSIGIHWVWASHSWLQSRLSGEPEKCPRPPPRQNHETAFLGWGVSAWVSASFLYNSLMILMCSQDWKALTVSSQLLTEQHPKQISTMNPRSSMSPKVFCCYGTVGHNLEADLDLDLPAQSLMVSPGMGARERVEF